MRRQVGGNNLDDSPNRRPWTETLEREGPGDLSDGECLLGIADGDSTCFAHLVQRYQGRIVNLIYRMVGNWDTALDLGQDTFLRIHKHARSFRLEGNAPAWITSIAMNLARDHLRGRKKRILYLESMDVADGSSQTTLPSSGSPHERLEVAERHDVVHEVLQELPDSPRAMLLLRDFEGMSYQQMAKLFDCEVGTIKSRLHRARKSFEELYSRKMS